MIATFFIPAGTVTGAGWVTVSLSELVDAQELNIMLAEMMKIYFFIRNWSLNNSIYNEVKPDIVWFKFLSNFNKMNALQNYTTNA